MAAARCSRCDLYMPKDRTQCPVCHSPTWVDETVGHSTDWRIQAERLMKRWELGKKLPNASCTIVEKDGFLFVTDEQLQEAGYLDLEAGSIVLVNGVYHEVEGPIFKETDIPSWWITEVVEGVTIGLKTLSQIQYETLNTRRGKTKETE